MPQSSSTEELSVIIADSDAFRREGIAAALQSSADRFRIVATCSSGTEALEEMQRASPAFGIVDLNLPGLRTPELLARLRDAGVSTRVIVVGGTEHPSTVEECLAAGASGYLLKDSPAKHLLSAIDYVTEGGRYLSPRLQNDVFEGRLRAEAEPASALRPSDIEQIVLSLLTQNMQPLLDRVAAVERRVFSFPDVIKREVEQANFSTVEAFVRNMQNKFAQRIAALEREVALHADTLKHLKGVHFRTEENVSRLFLGSRRSTPEVPRSSTPLTEVLPEPEKVPESFESPAPQPILEPEPGTIGTRPAFASPSTERRVRRRRKRPGTGLRLFWRAFALVIVVALLWQGARFIMGRLSGPGGASASISASERQSGAVNRLQSAENYLRRNEFGSAERVYREVLVSDPKNSDALRGLASALYRQDRFEESAAVLERIPLPTARP